MTPGRPTEPTAPAATATVPPATAPEVRSTSLAPADSTRLPADRPSIRHIDLTAMSEMEAQRWLGRLGAVMQLAATPDLPIGSGWAAERWAARRESLRGVQGYVAEVGDELVGCVLYRVFAVRRRRALHLFSAYVLPEHQGSGIAYTLNARIVFRELARHPFASHYLVMPMMTPIAFRGWRDRIATKRHFFPGLPGATPPADGLVVAATEIAAEHFPGVPFDPVTGVLSGVTPPRDRSAPPSGDPVVDDLFRTRVRPDRGDTVLIVVDSGPAQVLASVPNLVRAVRRSLRLRRRRAAGRSGG